MTMKYGASRTDPARALAMLQANGLTRDQALDLKGRAGAKKDKKVQDHGGWMIAHADGTWSSGAAGR